MTALNHNTVEFYSHQIQKIYYHKIISGEKYNLSLDTMISQTEGKIQDEYSGAFSARAECNKEAVHSYQEMPFSRNFVIFVVWCCFCKIKWKG